jgi:putative transposase
MRKSRFSEVQIVRILRQADAGERTVGQLYREHGISENTFYRWRRRYVCILLKTIISEENAELEEPGLRKSCHGLSHTPLVSLLTACGASITIPTIKQRRLHL